MNISKVIIYKTTKYTKYILFLKALIFFYILAMTSLMVFDRHFKTTIPFERMKLFGCSFHCCKAFEIPHNKFACICFRGKDKTAKYAKINTLWIKVCIQYYMWVASYLQSPRGRGHYILGAFPLISRGARFFCKNKNVPQFWRKKKIIV